MATNNGQSEESMLDRLIEFPERRPGGVIAAIGLVFCLAYGASLVLFPKPSGRIVVGDAVHFYVYLRSVVFDGDVRFQNEYVRLYDLQPATPRRSNGSSRRCRPAMCAT